MTWGYFCRACLRTFEVDDLVRVCSVNQREAFLHESCRVRVEDEWHETGAVLKGYGGAVLRGAAIARGIRSSDIVLPSEIMKEGQA